MVVCRYVGRLKTNGRVFDKTDKKPFAFRLGETQDHKQTASATSTAGPRLSSHPCNCTAYNVHIPHKACQLATYCIFSVISQGSAGGCL